MSISDFLNPAVLETAPQLARAFQSARPFRHIVIDDFLDAAFCTRICDQFPAFDSTHAIDENEQLGGKATREEVRSLGSAFADADDLVRHPDFLALVEQITGIGQLRYDPQYFGGGTHENRHGQDLDPHIDFNYHPRSGQHRRLNLIIYLNPEWEDGWGGSLQLHRNPYLEPAADEIVTVTPVLNRCVIFETTEQSWHGFEAIDLPGDRRQLTRKSFAIYYYTDTRPADQTAEQHSTVYVERHLPPRFQPGLTLGDADVREIKTLLQRRDQHLKRLYGDIQNLHGQLKRVMLSGGGGDFESWKIRELRSRIAELETSTSWRLTAPLRALKQMLSRRGQPRENR